MLFNHLGPETLGPAGPVTSLQDDAIEVGVQVAEVQAREMHVSADNGSGARRAAGLPPLRLIQSRPVSPVPAAAQPLPSPGKPAEAGARRASPVKGAAAAGSGATSAAASAAASATVSAAATPRDVKEGSEASPSPAEG